MEYVQNFSYGYEWVGVSKQPAIFYIYTSLYITSCSVRLRTGSHPSQSPHPEGPSQPTGQGNLNKSQESSISRCETPLKNQKTNATAHKYYSALCLEWNRQHSRGVFILMPGSVLLTFQDTLLISSFSDF